ncbi:CARDB domain-containing protein [Thalassoglobus sp.]|uniref:CARDB domain-containing protein n=1 Tax=Thalassoglobus sp. TaxID=2795869 RepID=UPI003AA80CEA
MSKPDHIPSPRHLFPEAAAWVISGKRGILRGRWLLKQERDWFPAWSIGSIAGVCGVMLAALLFFFEAPKLAASPTEREEVSLATQSLLTMADPEPVLPTSAPPFVVGEFPIQSRTSNLSGSELVRTELPYVWDQVEMANLESRPIRHRDPFVKDSWTTTARNQFFASNFTPYFVQGATVPVTPTYVTSSGARTEFDGVEATRSQAVLVEKQAVGHTTTGQSYSYEIYVTNRSNDPIDEVVLREQISAIHRVTEVSPPAAVRGDELVWSLGKLTGKERKILKVTLIPDSVKQIETQTTVSNKSRVGGNANVNAPVIEEPALLPLEPEEPVLPQIDEPPPKRVPAPSPISELPKPFPELKLAVTPVGIVKQGETLSLTFTISNVGTAAAENVSLRVNLSENFRHKFGEHIEHTITRLEPGQSRRALLQARALESGQGKLSASLEMQGTEEGSQDLDIQVEPISKSISSRRSVAPVVECKRPETLDLDEDQVPESIATNLVQWRKSESF